MTLSTSEVRTHYRDLTADTLRGIAIIMILLLHAFVMADGFLRAGFISEVVNRMTSGVQIFFVVSGFVISRSMDNTITRGENGHHFLIRRVAKLFPLYFIFLNLNILFFVFWSNYSTHPVFYRNSLSSDSLSWAGYLQHIVMLQGFFPGSLNTYVDGDWSIVCEAYFYLLIPVFLYGATRSATSAIWVLFWSFLSSLAFSVFSRSYLHGTGYYSYYAFPTQLPCFIIGICSYRIREVCQVNLPLNAQIATATIIVSLFFGFSRLEAAPLGGHIAIALLAGATLCLIRVSISTGGLGLVQAVGRMSYALFLSHILLLKIAYSVSLHEVGRAAPGIAFIANVMISIFIAGALSLILFDPIDRYAVALANRALARKARGRSLLAGETAS